MIAFARLSIVCDQLAAGTVFGIAAFVVIAASFSSMH
jgi:hypothetical protein